MKNLFLLVAVLFVTHFNAQKESQIIFNEVSIHFSRNHEMYNFWENREPFLQSFDKELNNESLPIKQHHDLLNFIINGLKSGKLKAFMPDIYSSYLQPSDYFKSPITKDSLDPSMHEFNYYGTQHNEYLNILNDVQYVLAYDPETDEPMYDPETGDDIIDLVTIPLMESDFVSFTFVEEWEFDINKSIMVKTVLGMTVNTNEVNEETGDIMGIQPRFYIQFNTYNKTAPNWKIAENFISTSNITGKEKDEKEEMQQYWWIDNIESSKRYNLIQPLFSGKYNYLEAKPPYNKAITDTNKILYKYEEYIMFDELYGEEMYDEITGDPMYQVDSSLYSYLDINKLGFIEDWYFDTINYSFGKDVKAIMPCAINYSETGELLKSTPLFLINVNGNTVNQKVNDFSLANHKASSVLINNQVKDLDKKRFGSLLKENSISVDSITQIKMNSFFINYPDSEGEKIYTRTLSQEYQIQKNVRPVMNLFEIMPRLDPETDEFLYDENTGDGIYDTIMIPYMHQNITGYKFIEDWNYNIVENQFDINITGVIPMMWHTNPENGEIMGEQELYMAKPNPNHKAEYALIKSNHVFTEPLSGDGMDDFWNYKENTEWLYAQKRKELITSLFEGIKSKKVQVVNPYNNEKIKLKNREAFIGDITFADIESIQFEEDIYFNYASGHFKKTVKSITFIVAGFDEFEDPWQDPWLKIIFHEK